MGLLRGIARTAAIAGTATAVSNRVSRRQAGRWAAKEQKADEAQQAQDPQQQQQYAQNNPQMQQQPNTNGNGQYRQPNGSGEQPYVPGAMQAAGPSFSLADSGNVAESEEDVAE